MKSIFRESFLQYFLSFFLNVNYHIHHINSVFVGKHMTVLHIGAASGLHMGCIEVRNGSVFQADHFDEKDTDITIFLVISPDVGVHRAVPWCSLSGVFTVNMFSDVLNVEFWGIPVICSGSVSHPVALKLSL